MAAESLEVALEVIQVLEDLGLAYHVGGSFASSLHGVPRQTRDLDLVVDLSPAVVSQLASRLEDRFYLDTETIHQSIRSHSSFNLVHFQTGFKIDVFVLGERPFDEMEFRRRRSAKLAEDLDREVMVKSPEDTVLRKLEWYRQGGEISDRQWTDILGIIRIQGEQLDLDYLRHWSLVLGVADLLRRALQEH